MANAAEYNLAVQAFKDGLITRIPDTDIPDGAFSNCENIDLDDKFVPKKSKGQQKYNASALSANPVQGAGKYVMADGTAYYVVACGGKLYYSVVGSGTFTTYKAGGADLTLSATANVEMVQYANSMWLVNGTYPVITNTGFGTVKVIKITGTKINDEVTGTADSGSTTEIVDNALVQADDYWNGGTVVITAGTNSGEARSVSDFDAATDKITVSATFTASITNSSVYALYKKIGDANTPQGAKYIRVHQERLFFAGSLDQLNGLYWTEPYEPENFTPEYGLNFDYVGRDDGEIITGIIPYQGYLYVGKPRNIYRYATQGDITEWQSFRVDTRLGWLYHRTVQEFNGLLIYLSHEGVATLNGNNAVLVSEQIRDKMLELPQLTTNIRQWLISTTAEFDAGTKGSAIETADNQITMKPQTPPGAADWQTLSADLPGIISTSGCSVRLGDYIYVLYTTILYRYSTTAGTWTTLGTVPFLASDFASICTDGTSIFASPSSGIGKTFWKYTVASDTWAQMLDNLFAPDMGSSTCSDGTYVYCLKGNGDTDFSRYNIGSNNWTSLTPITAFPFGAGAVYLSGYIYVTGGTSGLNLYRYNVSGNSWSTLTTIPAGVSVAKAAATDGTDLYFIFGFATNDVFAKYIVGTNAWWTDADMPSLGGSGTQPAGGAGCSLTFYGRFLYEVKGGATKTFYKYSIVGNSWAAPAFITSTFDFGFTPAAMGNLSATVVSGTVTYQTKTSATDLSDADWEAASGWSSPAQTNGAAISSATQRYLRVRLNLTAGASVSEVYVGANYRSATKDLGVTPAAWGQYNVAYTANGQTITHWLRTAATEGGLAAATWYQQTPGSIVTGAALAQWAQFEVRFNTALASQVPIVESVNIAFFTGSSLGSPCSAVWKNNYWLNIVAPGGTVNDTAYLFNTTGYWTKRTNKYNTIFFVSDGDFLSGSSKSDGFIRYNDVGTQDDTVDIVSFFETRAFELMAMLKIFRSILVTSKSDKTWSLSYSVDNGAYVAVTMSLQGFVTTVRKVFTGLVQGRFIKFKVTQALEDTNFEFHGFNLEWKPTRRLNAE